MRKQKRMQIQSPCLGCIRVPDPEKCDNKACVPWRRWFTGRWELLRRQYGLRSTAVLPTGELHPAALAQQEDPCKSCLCPRDLCQTPCGLRVVWETEKEMIL